jgi:hypothetical protein
MGPAKVIRIGALLRLITLATAFTWHPKKYDYRNGFIIGKSGQEPLKQDVSLNMVIWLYGGGCYKKVSILVHS